MLIRNGHVYLIQYILYFSFYSFIWSQDPNLERNWTRRTLTVTNSSRFVTVWCTPSETPYPRDSVWSRPKIYFCRCFKLWIYVILVTVVILLACINNRLLINIAMLIWQANPDRALQDFFIYSYEYYDNIRPTSHVLLRISNIMNTNCNFCILYVLFMIAK